MTYGLMSQRDYQTMDKVLELVHRQFPEGILNTLEIGVHKGFTSRGIKNFFEQKGRIIFHTGIDNEHDLPIPPPFEGCNLIIGNSMLVYDQIRDQSQHVVLFDACHNLPMTMIDFLLYKDKVVPNGYLIFHDTGRHIKPFTDYQGMGDKNNPDMYISCRKALHQLGLIVNPKESGTAYPNNIFKFGGMNCIMDEADETFHTGGITVFQKG